MTATFLCNRCARRVTGDEANLDADENLVCEACYLADPPKIDIDGVLAEIESGYGDRR